MTADNIATALGYAPANAGDVVSLSTTKRQTINSQLYIGSATTSISNAFTHIRKLDKVPDYQGRNVYGLAFAVGSDGLASMQYKTFDNKGTGGINEAVVRFSEDKFQYAKRSKDASANVPDE